MQLLMLAANIKAIDPMMSHCGNYSKRDDKMAPQFYVDTEV